jgi:Tripartite tricarboxylate transporter TctB family
MNIRVRNQPNLLSGLFFTIMGVGFGVYARNYQMGTASQMGPGYFPLVLGGLLAVMGLVITLQSLSLRQDEEKIEPLFFKPMLLVLGPVVLFGVMLMPAGLVLSSIVLIVLTSLASPEFNLKYVVPTALVLIVGCYLVFVYGLGLPIPVWIGGR